jgi:predicted ATP-grasp superfamily ATP-dependent carboligase
MHVFVYEWATGGGLVEEAYLPQTLIREGTAMISALAADFSRLENCRVTALRDPRVLHLALPGCELVDVLSTGESLEAVDRLAAEADATVLVAPEFDSILLNLARRVVAAGGRLLSPCPEFIQLTTNKQRTCEVLAESGVPTPPGQLLESDDTLPPDFSYPAVLKPLDGAGSQDTYLVSGPYDAPPAYAWARRLERYMPGMAASVAILCGPAQCTCLAPCRQRISEDGRFRYLGGELPLMAGMAERAIALAQRAIAALPPVVGYVGIDMVLGRNPHGDEDVLIEVNPRLTTSYVGLRAAARVNLAEAMWCIAHGKEHNLSFLQRGIEFDPSGNVSFTP